MRKSERDGPAIGEIETSILQGEFHPVYLFFGEEHAMMDDLLNLIISRALDESTRQFNLDVLDGHETTCSEIIARSLSLPMLGNRRVVVVREFEKLGNKEHLVGYAERPSKDTILVLMTSSADFRTKEMQALKSSTVAVRFPELNQQTLRAMAMAAVKVRGKVILPEAADLLVAYAGTSLADVRNALEKTILFSGARTEITSRDVLEVIGRAQGSDIYELQRHLARRDHTRAFETLFRLMDMGESPIGIIIMLTRYFQRVWCIDDAVAGKNDRGEATALLGIPSFAVKEYELAANRYRPEEFHDLFSALRTADEQLKSSAGDPRLIMTVLMTKLLGAPVEVSP